MGVKGLKDEASYRAQDRSETQSETTQNQFGVMFDTMLMKIPVVSIHFEVHSKKCNIGGW